VKKYILLIFFIVAGKLVFAQYFPVYSQYIFNGMAINPAYTGSREVFSLSLLNRNQWVGMKGAPVTQAFSAHAPLKNERVALGFLLTNDKIGVTSNSALFFNYAYRIFMPKGRLSLGLKAGVNLFNSNWQKITTFSSTTDPSFNQPSTQSFLPNFGVGAYYYSKRFFAGLSVPLMLSYRQKSQSDSYEFYHDVKQYNVHLTSGYLFDISEMFKFKPSFLLKYSLNSTWQLDLNGNMILFNDRIWLGASYRIKDAVAGIMELKITDQLNLGYAYDYSLGEISKFQNGSHEILLRYEFTYKIKTPSPRYF